MGAGLALVGRHKNGTEIAVDITLRPLWLDDQLLIMGAIRDITVLRRLEQAERAVHAQTVAQLTFLQQVLDALPSSVHLVYGPDGRLLLANRAARSLWGAGWQVHQPFLEFLSTNGIALFDPQGRLLPASALATLRAARQGETVLQQQETIRRPDGSSLPILVSAVPLTALPPASLLSQEAEKEQLEGERVALVVHHDVTALKEAEYLKDEFIGLAAHELRTPLAALKGYTELLLVQTARGHGPALAPWQQEVLEELKEATGRLVSLSENLLDVTRLQAGQLQLQQIPTKLTPLVQRVVSRCQQTTNQHQIEVHTPQAALVANIDPGRIDQVLSNLIGNAIKYSPQGGLIHVSIEEETTAPMVRLSVQDHGIGIPKQSHARIFGRFIRVENAKDRGISGTGLGLYLCRELVERHGGRIWFESEEGAGSTFFLTLPLVVAPELESESGS
jgi:signal transduction histidine kinase